MLERERVSSVPSPGQVGVATQASPARLMRIGLQAVAYLLIVVSGAALFGSSAGVPSLLPSVGFLVGWMVLSDRSDWPAIVTMAAVAHLAASTFRATEPFAAAGVALAEVGASALCAMVLAAGQPARRDEDLVGVHLQRLVLITPLVAAPAFAVVSTLLTPGEQSGRLLVEHTLAFLLGAFIVTPLFLTFAEFLRWLRRDGALAKVELVATVLLVLATSNLAYLSPVTGAEQFRAFQVLVLVPLLWAGSRTGAFAAAWTVAIVGAYIEYGTSRGLGVMSAMAGDAFRHTWFSAIYLMTLAFLSMGNAVIVGGLRRAVSALASTERWFRELAEASPLPMIAIEPDQQTLIFNKALTALYGYDARAIRTSDDFWRLVLPDPEERNSVTREWYARVAEARHSGASVRPLAFRGVAADGTHRYTEAHASEIGERRLILLVDRTADREAKSARRAGEQLFRQLIDSAPIPIMMVESDQETLALNRTFTELLGWDGDDMPTVTRYLEQVFPDPAYRKRMDDTWKRRLAEWRESGRPFRPVTAQFRCKDGNDVFLEVRTSASGTAASTRSWTSPSATAPTPRCGRARRSSARCSTVPRSRSRSWTSPGAR